MECPKHFLPGMLCCIQLIWTGRKRRCNLTENSDWNAWRRAFASVLCTFEGSMGFSLTEVIAAQRLIAGLARVTPLIEAQSFTTEAGHPILLKLETLQPIGAFKIRGAAHA